MATVAEPESTLRQRKIEDKASDAPADPNAVPADPNAVPADSKQNVAVPVRTADENKALMVDNLMQNIPDWVPPSLKPKIQLAASYIAPAMKFIGNFLDIVYPWLVLAWEYAVKGYKIIEPYRPDLMMPMFFGLILMFFGGHFVLTIAAFEAFRLAGYSALVDACKELYKNYRTFMDATQEDDALDEDGDGIADVLQISEKELLTRKLQVFLLNTDPHELSNAMNAIYSGCIGVLATLKIQFAKTITLGATIGENLYEPCAKILVPILINLIPSKYQKWIQVGLNYACRSIGVSIAWMLQRIISAVHAAIRGANVFTDAFAAFTAYHGYTMLSTGYFDEVFAAICCVVGLWCQISNLFILPWYLSIILLPFITLEFTIQIAVSMF